jgi:hypothetical protein
MIVTNLKSLTVLSFSNFVLSDIDNNKMDIEVARGINSCLTSLKELSVGKELIT